MPRTVELDVRHYHAEGREPFGDIMGAIEGLEAGDTFVLRNTFEPVPLYSALRSHGFSHEVRQAEADDWFITFSKQ